VDVRGDATFCQITAATCSLFGATLLEFESAPSPEEEEEEEAHGRHTAVVMQSTQSAPAYHVPGYAHLPRHRWTTL